MFDCNFPLETLNEKLLDVEKSYITRDIANLMKNKYRVQGRFLVYCLNLVLSTVPVIFWSTSKFVRPAMQSIEHVYSEIPSEARVCGRL